MMNRRGFLSRLLGGAAAVAAPSVVLASQKIWVPKEQSLAVPDNEIQIANSLVSPGSKVFGYLISPRFVRSLDLIELSKDAIHYFPDNAPVVILSNTSGFKLKNETDFIRFCFYGGDTTTVVTKTKAEMVGGFEGPSQFGWIAMNRGHFVGR